MKGGIDTEIEMYGRMMIALEELESCREFAALIPEVRTNMVYARPDARTTKDVLGIDGRITVIGGMPRAAGRPRYGTSSHMARLVLEIRKHDPSVRAGINFANSPHLSAWLDHYCRERGWAFSAIDRGKEPVEIREEEGASMQWKAAEAVRAADGRVPRIICDAGGTGKEPVCVIVGNNPVGIAQDLCEIARAHSRWKK
jgi:hydroxymethylpyrimidine/phosphomethylpyrimidine kinase